MIIIDDKCEKVASGIFDLLNLGRCCNLHVMKIVYYAWLFMVCIHIKSNESRSATDFEFLVPFNIVYEDVFKKNLFWKRTWIKV